MTEHLLRRSDFHHSAEIHHADPVGDMAHQMQSVADEQIGQSQPLFQILQQIDHLRLDRHIQGRYRLVRNDKPWMQRNRAGDRHALALSSRQRMRIARLPRRIEADLLQQIPHPGTPFGCAQAFMHHKRLADDLPKCPARVDRSIRVLEDHLHVPAASDLARHG